MGSKESDMTKRLSIHTYIVSLRRCASFRCRGEWIRHTHVYTLSGSACRSSDSTEESSSAVSVRTLSSYPSHTWWCVCAHVHPGIPACLCPASPWPPWVCFPRLWLYFCFINKLMCTSSLDSTHNNVYDIAYTWTLKSFLKHGVCQTNHLWEAWSCWLLLPSQVLIMYSYFLGMFERDLRWQGLTVERGIRKGQQCFLKPMLFSGIPPMATLHGWASHAGVGWRELRMSNTINQCSRNRKSAEICWFIWDWPDFKNRFWKEEMCVGVCVCVCVLWEGERREW